MSGTWKRLPAVALAVAFAVAGWPPPAARGQEAPARTVDASGPEEARRLREQGDGHASQDRHEEAIRAYRAAIAADPSLEPEIAPSLGASLLWADRTAEAVPVLAAASARNPGDVETKKLLALAYRWNDQLDKAERLSREILAEQPGDLDERNGLAVALLWQGRHREAAVEFERVLAAKPDDAEALLGLSRARLEMDLPEAAEGPAARALAIDPKNAEAASQLAQVRRRLARHIEGGIRGSYDSDQLALWEFSLGAHGRPVRGLDLGVVATELLFRQGSPGKDVNIGQVDEANGTGGALLLSYHPAPSYSLRASAGLVSYDVSDFQPWVGSAGATWFSGDLWRFALDWDHAPYDTILSFQNHVTVDTVTVAVARAIPWKTEVTASAAVLFQHNQNDTGQPTENQGERFELGVARRLYLEGDGTRLTGLIRLSYLGFQKDLDVGMYDPRRQTAEEIGLDGRWAFRPRWEAFGTAMVGAQQEEGSGGSPTYSLELGVDREIGAAGKVTLGGFAADSAAAGRGAGYRRQGGYLRFRIPF